MISTKPREWSGGVRPPTFWVNMEKDVVRLGEWLEEIQPFGNVVKRWPDGVSPDEAERWSCPEKLVLLLFGDEGVVGKVVFNTADPAVRRNAYVKAQERRTESVRRIRAAASGGPRGSRAMGRTE